MTYDVQRFYCWRDEMHDPARMASDAPDYMEVVVLAADAEAHERAAVDLAVLRCDHERIFSIQKAHEQAIRDCIAAVNAIEWEDTCCGCSKDFGKTIEALRALLEVDTPQHEPIKHINLQNAGREPNISPVGYDPRAAENRP